MLGAIVSVVLSGFVIGSLARLALPGPDPLSFALTVLLGLAGSLVGGGIAAASFGASHTFDTSGHVFATLLLEIGAAAALLSLYRRYVQRRPLAGPDAYRFPSRGFGIARMRERLHRLGVDPDSLGRGPVRPDSSLDADERLAELTRLREQHERGELSDEELEQARERLRRY